MRSGISRRERGDGRRGGHTDLELSLRRLVVLGKDGVALENIHNVSAGGRM